ncbi:MAG: hypothetical protein WB762_07730 [Candidatus Sulfotelmatobacter sp.]
MARYSTGYLGDMGTLPPYGLMDFAAWIEVYLGGALHTFDPRNNVPRIGRVLIARGRDAARIHCVNPECGRSHFLSPRGNPNSRNKKSK